MILYFIKIYYDKHFGKIQLYTQYSGYTRRSKGGGGVKLVIYA